VASLSLGLSHLNTVERRKIRSGSSAAEAGAACYNVSASTAKARLFQFLSNATLALDVIDISAEGLAAYVVPECRTGRPQSGFEGPSTAYGWRQIGPRGFNGM
jgi:hypothetical protein